MCITVKQSHCFARMPPHVNTHRRELLCANQWTLLYTLGIFTSFCASSISRAHSVGAYRSFVAQTVKPLRNTLSRISRNISRSTLSSDLIGDRPPHPWLLRSENQWTITLTVRDSRPFGKLHYRARILHAHPANSMQNLLFYLIATGSLNLLKFLQLA